MTIDVTGIQVRKTTKRPGPEDGPGKCWLVARINLSRLAGVSEAGACWRNPEAAVFCSRRIPWLTPNLRRSSRPYRQIPHLGQNARHLHPIQLRDKGQQLRDKLVLH